MTAAWNVYMKHFLCMMFVMGCLCIPVEMNAQSCRLRFNMDGVKLQNPTEKRLNGNGDFVDPRISFSKKFSRNVEGKDLHYVRASLEEIDSLMNLETILEYEVIKHSVCTPSDFEPLIAEQKARLQKLSEEFSGRAAGIDALKARIGKKLESKEQENLIVSIIDEMASKGIYAPSDALKDLKKGKISKTLADLLNQYSALNAHRKEFADRNLKDLDIPDIRLEVLFSLMKYPTYNDLPDAQRTQFQAQSRPQYWVKVNHKEIEFPSKAVYDTIPNPVHPVSLALFPENSRNINYLKISKAQENYAWLDSDDYTVESASYPMKIHYRKYASHPEYKVSDTDSAKGVFDAEGNIVAYVIPGRMGLNPVDNNIVAIYAHAYNENAYDIKNAPALTQNYILEKAEVKFREGSRAQRMARARIKRIDEASLAKPDNDYMVAAILADRKASQITQQDVQDQIKYYSREGENWLEQISSDWHKRLNEDCASWTEVLSPTSYSVTYLDENGAPVLREIYKVRNTTPYRIEVVKSVEFL